MRTSYRVLIAEIVLTSFISTLIPSSLLFAEDTAPAISDVTDIVNTEDSVVESSVGDSSTDAGNTIFPETTS